MAFFRILSSDPSDYESDHEIDDYSGSEGVRDLLEEDYLVLSFSDGSAVCGPMSWIDSVLTLAECQILAPVSNAVH